MSASNESSVVPATNAVEEKKADASTELSLADIEKMREDMEKTMPKDKAEEIASVFRKFTKDTTDEEKFMGFVSISWTCYVAESWVSILIACYVRGKIQLDGASDAGGQNGSKLQCNTISEQLWRSEAQRKGARDDLKRTGEMTST